ncbi:MAG: PorT family protein [Bacteroidetes bacterium]|nr:PorT family protein [Bacteroidota bacterium]
MKTIHMMLMSWALLAPLCSEAQESKTSSDTTKILNGKLKIIANEKDGKKKGATVSLSTKRDRKRKIVETSYGSFDIGFNNYNDETMYGTIPLMPNEDNSFFNFLPNAGESDFELRTGKSLNINFGIAKFQLSLYKNYINLVTGLTYDINNWSYKKAIVWNKEPDFQTANFQGAYVSRDTVNTFKKNKLVTNYLQVPLLLRIETSPNNDKHNVYLSAGGYAGYLTRVHTKQVNEGSRKSTKQFEDFNITKVQYGAQFELGYQGVSVYFKKSFTPLTDYGTEQYPYSFGLRLTGL